jgi:hypothetical protein
MDKIKLDMEIELFTFSLWDTSLSECPLDIMNCQPPFGMVDIQCSVIHKLNRIRCHEKTKRIQKKS